MPHYGMVIDTHRCIGCDSCILACKSENNTPDRARGQSFNWTDLITRTTGTYPNARFEAFVVQCNHCSNAPCVEVCPVEPKAMYKNKDGIVVHNSERCIGCQMCQFECPYSSDNLDYDDAEYSVISFNEFDIHPHEVYADETELITGGTASGAEVARNAGKQPPDRMRYKHPDFKDVRRDGIVEKCMFCHHRVVHNMLPACADACPAGARIFGDLNDPTSEVRHLLDKYPARRFKNNKGELLADGEEGTGPNLYYIRSYGPERS